MIFLYQRIKGLVSAPVGSPRCGSHALRIPAALPREAAQPWPGLHLGSSIECWSAWYSMLVASKMASNISNKYTAKPSIFEVLMILTHSWNGFDQKKGPSYCCWVAPSAMRWGLSWPPQSLRVEIPPTWTIRGLETTCDSCPATEFVGLVWVWVSPNFRWLQQVSKHGLCQGRQRKNSDETRTAIKGFDLPRFLFQHTVAEFFGPMWFC